MSVFFLLIFFLSFLYGINTGQIEFFFSILGGYVLCMSLLKIFLKPQQVLVFKLFSLFYFVYGLLVLLTQIQLIHDPMQDYYVHNDAAWSFYHCIMNYVLPCTWSELYEKTLVSPAFYHYPLAAFIMGFFGKLGHVLGIVDLRLFMRIHVFMMGATIIAMMTNLLLYYGIDKRKVKNMILLFGFCSYLYIGSAIFSRDLHVCFVYTIGAYICLKKDVRFKPLWFVILFFMAFGFRPQNGFVFLAYPFFNYIDIIKRKIGIVGIVCFVLLLLGVVLYMNDYLNQGLNSLDYYDDLAKENTGGIFITLYSLPFPLNTIIMVIYITIMPLPLFFYCIGEGMTWLNLPVCLSAYILVPSILTCLYYIFKNKYIDTHLRNIILVSFIVYSVIIFGSPDLRRAFAAIPGLFMCYGIIESKIPQLKLRTIKRSTWTLLTIINVFFLFYVTLR